MCDRNSSSELANCTFSFNSATSGGGIDNRDGSSLSVTNSTFSNNSVEMYGGGMHNHGSYATLAYCIFTGNQGPTAGGLLSGRYSETILNNCFFIGNQVTSSGGGMRGWETTAILANCTFVGNSAANGSAMACDSYEQRTPSVISATNCIFWFGNEVIWNNDASTITIMYSDVQGGWLGEGNIDVDPFFVDPGYLDSNNVWIEGDYHLKSQVGRYDPATQTWVYDDVTSPCIDAGSPGCPPDNEPALNGNRINIGVYGGTAEASKSPANWRDIADLTNDWVVDSKDLKVFTKYWLNIGGCIPSDFNRSQFVDFKDFALYAKDWLEFFRLFTAHNPNPADGAVDIPVDANLSWNRGKYCIHDDVHFGTDPCALPLVITIPAEALPPLYEPAADLIASTTYYWQVVEIDGPDIYPGTVWDFTTVRGEARPVFPANGAVIPGENYPPIPPHTHIFTELDFVPGATAVMFTGYFSSDYLDVYNRVQDANLGEPPYSTMPNRFYVGLPIDSLPYQDSLDRGTVYYWTVDSKDARGNTFLGEIWEFTIQGFKAFAPSPPNEAVFVDTDVLLSWKPGYEVEEHDVYMSTSWDDVNNAVYDSENPPTEFLGTISDPNILVIGLPPNTNHYWRVDEVTGRIPPIFSGTYYKGDVWCFKTRP